MFTKRDLLKLLIPLALEQILGTTVGMIDVIMISTIGESAISGLSLVDSINTLLFGLFASLSTGGVIVLTHFIGRKDYRLGTKAASQLILITTAFSLLLSTIALIGNHSIISFFFGNLEIDVMNYATIYFLITALSFPAMSLYNSLSSIFRAMGNTKVSLYVSLIANGINIIGNAVFLFVFNWGVAGVAIATLLSRIASSTIMLYLLNKNNYPIKICRKDIFTFNSKIIGRILSFGLPNSFESFIFQIGKILVTGVISTLGTSAIAANAIANNVSSFTIIPGNAIGIGIITVVGQVFGTGDIKMTKKYTKLLLKWGFCIIFLLNIGLFFTSPFIVKLYNLEAHTASTTVNLLRYYSLTCALLWPFSFALPNALRAVGEARYTMLLSILSMWIFRIGFSYILALYFNIGILGVWIAISIDWLCRSICFSNRFFNGKWSYMSKNLMD